MLTILIITFFLFFGFFESDQDGTNEMYTETVWVEDCTGKTHSLVSDTGEIVGTATLSFDTENGYITIRFVDESWVLDSFVLEISKEFHEGFSPIEDNDQANSIGIEMDGTEWKKPFQLSSAELESGDTFYLTANLMAHTGSNELIHVTLLGSDLQTGDVTIVQSTVEQCENRPRIMRRDVRW